MKFNIQKKLAATLIAATLGVATCVFAEDAKDTKGASSSATNSTPAAETAGPSKFYGPVSAVDTKAKTFTVGDQTFTVATESHLTKDSKPATLADAVVGEPARGTYTTGKDGKLVATKVRFGKAGGKAGEKSGGKKKKSKDAASDTSSSSSSTNAPANP